MARRSGFPSWAFFNHHWRDAAGRLLRSCRRWKIKGSTLKVLKSCRVNGIYVGDGGTLDTRKAGFIFETLVLKAGSMWKPASRQRVLCGPLGQRICLTFPEKRRRR